MMRQFRNIFFDISGICNSKCPYCLSGRYKVSSGGYIETNLFEQVLKRLTALQLVGTRSILGLYNWGEPFLHPRLGELVQIINRFNISYAFSTNASIVPDINRQFVQGLKMIIFSMPGFSQSSYDRIHGFNFPSITRNIETIVDRARSAGFKGEFRIHYHVYQFNLGEIPQGQAFSRHLRINLQLQYAILNNWDHLRDYIDNKLPYSLLKEISQDLFCFHLHEIVNEKVGLYRCPQYDLLALDECANVLLCCQVPKGNKYSAGNILHDDIERILKYREHNDVCSGCITSGMAPYFNRALYFPLFGSSKENSFPKTLGKIYRKLRNYCD